MCARVFPCHTKRARSDAGSGRHSCIEVAMQEQHKHDIRGRAEACVFVAICCSACLCMFWYVHGIGQRDVECCWDRINMNEKSSGFDNVLIPSSLGRSVVFSLGFIR